MSGHHAGGGGHWPHKEVIGLLLVMANLFLLFHLLSGEWDVLEKAKTLVELLVLAGGAGLFAVLRRIIAHRTGANVLVLIVLGVLSLPLYGSAFSVKPGDTKIYLGGENEEFPLVKRCCLSLHKMELKFVRDPFEPESRTVRAHNLFLSFWGSRATEVVLKARYDLWFSDLPATFSVDGGPEQGVSEHKVTLLLTPGEHTLTCKSAYRTPRPMKVEVPGGSQFIECFRASGE